MENRRGFLSKIGLTTLLSTILPFSKSEAVSNTQKIVEKKILRFIQRLRVTNDEMEIIKEKYNIEGKYFTFYSLDQKAITLKYDIVLEDYKLNELLSVYFSSLKKVAYPNVKFGKFRFIAIEPMYSYDYYFEDINKDIITYSENDSYTFNKPGSIFTFLSGSLEIENVELSTLKINLNLFDILMDGGFTVINYLEEIEKE